MLPHTSRGQDSVLLGDGLADEAVLLLRDPLDLGQDVFWYDVAFCQCPQGHVDRTCEQAQHPVLGRFRDSSMERDVRDYSDALFEFVHLYRPFDYEPVLLRTLDGVKLLRRHIRNIPCPQPTLKRKLGHVQQEKYALL